MKQPLILCLYERMLPGTQLLTRLQDLGYEVKTLNEPGALAEKAEKEKPLLVILDLEPHVAETCQALTQLKQNTATAHLPVIALASAKNTAAHESARAAGASLVVYDNAILLHLKQFLEQALQVD